MRCARIQLLTWRQALLCSCAPAAAAHRLGEPLQKPSRLVAPSLVALGPGVWHLAKDKPWGRTVVRGR